MIPQLNQTVTLYRTITANRRGDRTASNPTVIKGRLSTGQKTEYNQRGQDQSYNASLHVGPFVIIQKGNLVSYAGELYTVANVTATRSLNGQVLFQWCQLQIQGGVSI